MLRNATLLSVAALLSAPAAYAQTDALQATAASAVSDFNARASEIITDKGLSASARFTQFRALLDKTYALDFLARFLGGDAYTKATPDQQASYKSVFPNYVTALYLDQFGKLVGKTQRQVSIRTVGASEVFVRTEVKRTSGAPATLEWRVRKGADGQFRIVDVATEGVSNALGKRAEFAAFARDKGFEALIADLKKRGAPPQG